MILMTRRPGPPAVATASVILGWVVVVFEVSGKTSLTNADLMDFGTAQHEAGVCRYDAFAKGNGRRYEVRPVMGDQ